MLAFLAGNVNAGGFMATGRFVTHVTGFSTLFGVDAAFGRWDQAIGILSVPLFFLCGSMLSAYLVDHRFHRGLKPHYDWVMFLVFLSLMAVALGGYFHIFDQFGSAPRLKEDYAMLALLCMASGLQNAAITTSSGASVRTTHLTGLTTDLGIGIVRALGSPRGATVRSHETRANWLRFGTISAFISGSLVGGILFLRFEYLGFLLPAIFAFYAMIQARIDHPS